MTTRKTNTILRTIAAMFIGGGAMAIAVAMIAPIGLETVGPTSADPSNNPRIAASTSDVPPLDQFEPIFAALQAQPEASTTPPAVTSAGGLTLVGTVGDRIAMIRNGGETEVKSIGDRIDNAELIAVRSGEIDMRTPDGVVTLRKPSESTDPEFIHPQRKP